MIVRPREPLPAPAELGAQPIRERRYLSRREFAARYGADSPGPRRDRGVRAESRPARPPGERRPPQRRPRRTGGADAGRVLHPALPLPLAARRLPRAFGPPPRPGLGRAGDRGGARPRRPPTGDGRLPRRPAGARRAGPQDLVHAAADRQALRLPAPPRRKRPDGSRCSSSAAAFGRRTSSATSRSSACRCRSSPRSRSTASATARRRPRRRRRGDARRRGDRRDRPGRRSSSSTSRRPPTAASSTPSRRRSSTRRGPSILSISWGQAESEWTEQAPSTRSTRRSRPRPLLGITCLRRLGRQRLRRTASDGRVAHVDFPASSPHVLACGGTRLAVTDDGIDEVGLERPTTATRRAAASALSTPCRPGRRARTCRLGQRRRPRGSRRAGRRRQRGSRQTGYLVGDGVNDHPVRRHERGRAALGRARRPAEPAPRRAVGLPQPAAVRARPLGLQRRHERRQRRLSRAGTAWDACTGHGTPRGRALLDALSS